MPFLQQQDSPVVFKIVRETLVVLQRVEARVRAAKNDMDADLFMIKNILVLKNELVSLEIGDIRAHQANNALQHFSRVWESIGPGSWLGLIGNIVPGWSRGGAGGKPVVAAGNMTVEDMSEQLDELLRQSITAFTGRWAARMNAAGPAGRGKLEGELRGLLMGVFAEQGEVVGKLVEAVEGSARALRDAEAGKNGARRY